MKLIQSIDDFEDIVEDTPYLLSMNAEEANVLVESVERFRNTNIDKAPETDSLLHALKEIQIKYETKAYQKQQTTMIQNGA